MVLWNIEEKITVINPGIDPSIEIPKEDLKQAEKILLTSESIHHDFPETAIKVERDVDYQDVSSIFLNSPLFTASHAESSS